jgi:hypothetical protein
VVADTKEVALAATRDPVESQVSCPKPKLVSMGGCITSALTGWSAVEVVGAVLGTVSSRAGRGVGEMAAG